MLLGDDVELEVEGSTQGIAIAAAPGLSANELIAVLEQLPSGVVVVDGQGQPVLANHAARQLPGTCIDDSLPLLARALRGESVSGEELTVSNADGDEALRLRVSGIALRDQFLVTEDRERRVVGRRVDAQQKPWRRLSHAHPARLRHARSDPLARQS